MPRVPTIRQLRYFIALVEHQHFGHAAEACHVSQSAFSVAIKELENQLEAQLVDRTNKQVTVTGAGREFAAGARRILEQLEALVDNVGGHKGPLEGKLRLGVIPTIAPFLTPPLLKAARQRYPDLKLYLVEDITRRLYERLMAGEIDLILLALPYELRGVETLSLFHDPFHLAWHRDSTLITTERHDPEQLPEDAILLLEDGHCLRDHAISACRLRDQDKVSRFAATSLITLIQMVDEDLGVTYLPEMAIGSSLLSQTDIKTEKLGDDSYREIGLAWRKNSARAAEFELLGELVEASRRAPVSR